MNATYTSVGRIFLLWLLAVAGLSSCKDNKELVDQPLYTGPLSSLDSINTLLSDSGNLIMHLMADRQNNFENQDREWPEGLFLESFNDEGKISIMFSANYVYYNNEEQLYRAEGNVLVRSYENGDELNTEELFWSPRKKEFYTEKFVTIKSEGEVHTGEGMEANQDFTSYRILKPKGTFTLDEEPQNKSEASEEIANTSATKQIQPKISPIKPPSKLERPSKQ